MINNYTNKNPKNLDLAKVGNKIIAISHGEF